MIQQIKFEREPEYFIQPIKIKKSFNFLYPLLGFKQDEEFKPFSTYLYWSKNEDYSIDNYNLLVYYKTDFNKEFKEFEKEEILSKENVVACFEVDEGIVYIFDMVGFGQDIGEFIDGCYSKFNDGSKKIIMKYFGDPDIKTVRPGRPIHMTLYPSLYRSLISEELSVNEEDITELAAKFDKEEETIHVDILEKLKCCQDKTFYL